MKRYFITNKGKFIDTQAKNVTSIEVIDKDKADKEYGWDCGFICIYYCDDTGDHCETDDKGGKSMDNYDFPDIVKQADTIEELIKVGDLYTMLLLIDMGEAIVEETYEIKNEADLDDFMECVKMGDIAINKLYTKQGNDYILVACKENGEWRVL